MIAQLSRMSKPVLEIMADSLEKRFGYVKKHKLE